MKRICAMVCIVAMYGIYMFATPEPQDGVVFATVLAAVTGLAGYGAAKLQKAK